MDSSNHHQPAPAMTCDRMALLLPILDDDETDPLTTADALAHLRTCSRCQRERQRFVALDVALRDRFSFASVPFHTTEEIMQNLNERDHDTQDTPMTSRSPIARPPLRSAKRAWLSGLGAVAIVALLLGTAALLFSGRLGFGGPASWPTGPAHPSLSGTKGIISAVSMVSPTEGWALAQITKTPNGNVSADTVTFYHYQHGVWTPNTVKLSAAAGAALRDGGPGGFNASISMDSATDGWAVASNFNQGSVVFHYMRGSWQEVSGEQLSRVQAISPQSAWGINGAPGNLPRPELVHFDGSSWTSQTIAGTLMTDVVDFHMASDKLGWALMWTGGETSEGTYEIAQYNGSSWSVHSTLDAGGLGNIGALAMVSPTEGWAIGQRGIDGPQSVTGGVPVPQVLYHYTNGSWQSVSFHLNESVSFLSLVKIVMHSANDGWIIAQEQNQRPGITASGIQRRTVLLHYDGSSWSEVASPNSGGDVSEIDDMAFAGGSGWAVGYVATIPGGQTIQDDQTSLYGQPLLWQYSAGGWSLYQQG